MNIIYVLIGIDILCLTLIVIEAVKVVRYAILKYKKDEQFAINKIKRSRRYKLNSKFEKIDKLRQKQLQRVEEEYTL
jgi:hypothetical protein